MNGVRLVLGLLFGALACCSACCSTAGTVRAMRVVEGRGIGLPAADAATPERQRMTACRAAYLAALADLAGKVYGTQIQAEAKVVNMQFAGESVRAGVCGLVEGVEVVSNTYDPHSGTATAVVRVSLDGQGRVAPGCRLPGPAKSGKRDRGWTGSGPAKRHDGRRAQ